MRFGEDRPWLQSAIPRLRARLSEEGRLEALRLDSLAGQVPRKLADGHLDHG